MRFFSLFMRDNENCIIPYVNNDLNNTKNKDNVFSQKCLIIVMLSLYPDKHVHLWVVVVSHVKLLASKQSVVDVQLSLTPEIFTLRMLCTTSKTCLMPYHRYSNYITNLNSFFFSFYYFFNYYFCTISNKTYISGESLRYYM